MKGVCVFDQIQVHFSLNPTSLSGKVTFTSLVECKYLLEIYKTLKLNYVKTIKEISKIIVESQIR